MIEQWDRDLENENIVEDTVMEGNQEKEEIKMEALMQHLHYFIEYEYKING